MHLECPRAIKCPQMLLDPTGLKKVQQTLERTHSLHLVRLRLQQVFASACTGIFAPMYPMDTFSVSLEGHRLATSPGTATQFVFKPQRESVGGSACQNAILSFFRGFNEDQWLTYVLMEMIESPAQQNTLLRDGELQSRGV